ncbi:MAG: hypothetical protein A2521_17150 [Deltaproteobacteria bacterium RIFOXYD12_FULL_57_12]|nr:MAG: hypothetical protein A2521_17150 [Deltaproteobacteria bacterium RIFOXYD12_FULL_57_12]
MAERLQNLWLQLVAWIWTPDPPGQRHPGLLRWFLQVQMIIIRESQQARIGLRASALTFTVVLSLVPTLALGTAVSKGLGAGDQMRQAAYRFIERFESSVGPDAAEAAPAAEQSEPADQAKDSLADHLHRAVDMIFNYVDRTNFATLGVFGIVGLLAAVISFLSSIEQSINSIWQTEANRPFARRVMDYLALMILLPVTVLLALTTETVLASPAILEKIQFFFPLAWLPFLFLKLLPLVAVVATFALLYAFLPNTSVKLLPACIGGILGGISWIVVQAVYIRMQIGVARYNAIYGSFATLPLFLMWIYIGWLVFLAGAEATFAVQVRRHYVWKKLVLTPARRLALAFDVVLAVVSRFHERKTTDRLGLARCLNQPAYLVGHVLDDLLEAGILRHVDGEPGGYVPAGPSEEITPAEIVNHILGTPGLTPAANPLAVAALHGAAAALHEKKLIS